MHLDTPNKYACILKQKSCLCRRGGTLTKNQRTLCTECQTAEAKRKKKDFGEKTRMQSCFNTQLQDGQSSKVGGEEEIHSDHECELVIVAFQGEGKPEEGSCWLIEAYNAVTFKHYILIINW